MGDFDAADFDSADFDTGVALNITSMSTLTDPIDVGNVGVLGDCGGE